MQPNIFFEHRVVKKNSEMNKNKSELFPFPKLLNLHLLRTRTPGYLEIVMLREQHTLFLEIFAHLQILRFKKHDIWQYKRKTGGRFCENLAQIIFVHKSEKIQY